MSSKYALVCRLKSRNLLLPYEELDSSRFVCARVFSFFPSFLVLNCFSFPRVQHVSYIGRGAWGVVSRATYTDSQGITTTIAMKELKVRKEKERESLEKTKKYQKGQ